ncbi:MAG TPA: methyltransferase domain-containing protein [Clostridia bacterium]|nr:methyltransferase domain-containing protein [Clostridia bacterium]
MTCPICGGGHAELLYKMDGFELLKCTDCGLVFQNGADTLDSSGMIRAIYAESWVKMKEQAAAGDLYNHYLFTSHLADCHGGPGGRLLEIGCGTGEFLHLLKLMGRQVTGIEPSEKACAFAKTRYQLNLINSVWNVSLLKDMEKFHTIVFWHVLEHIPNPSGFLTEVASVLSDGGRILFCVPSNNCLDNRILSKASPIYTERDHLFHYSENNLPLLLTKAGLEAKTIFLWEGPSRLKSDWELYKRVFPLTELSDIRDEYSFLAWLRINRLSHELFCIAEKKPER